MEARAFLNLPALPVAGEDHDAREAARRLWRRCRAIDGTYAEAYLRSRGLARCRFPALRFHPELFCRDAAGVRRLPALVAAVTDGDGTVHGVQRTWLDPRAPAKADVAAPRKALGRIHGRAVRFGQPAAGASLLVGEGIETVLSVVTAVPDITAAAALSAGSLGAFAPPRGIARVVIARDHDTEGEHAAACLARRCARAGVGAVVIVPQYGDGRRPAPGQALPRGGVPARPATAAGKCGVGSSPPHAQGQWRDCQRDLRDGGGTACGGAARLRNEVSQGAAARAQDRQGTDEAVDVIARLKDLKKQLMEKLESGRSTRGAMTSSRGSRRWFAPAQR